MSKGESGRVAWALEEALRCLYCGFCEAVCPTLRHGPHRGYGPRGRVFIAASLLRGEEAGGEALASIYSCLTCMACTVKCPVSINVADIIRVVRSLLFSGSVRGKGPMSITVRGDASVGGR